MYRERGFRDGGRMNQREWSTWSRDPNPRDRGGRHNYQTQHAQSDDYRRGDRRDAWERERHRQRSRSPYSRGWSRSSSRSPPRRRSRSRSRGRSDDSHKDRLHGSNAATDESLRITIQHGKGYSGDQKTYKRSRSRSSSSRSSSTSSSRSRSHSPRKEQPKVLYSPERYVSR